MSGSTVVSTRQILSIISRARTGCAPSSVSVAIYMHDLAGGGVERQSLILAEELRRAGVAVVLVLHQLRGQLMGELPGGLRVVNLNSPRTIGDVPRLAAFLRRERPDILLANVDMNNIAALLAKGLSFSGTKVVICQHNSLSMTFARSESWTYRWVPQAYRALLPLISRAVAVSDGVGAELRSLAHLPPERVVTINNPVIGPDFHSRSQKPAHHPWFNDRGGPVFVTAGRLVMQKDHETMLRALALHRCHAESRLIILGSGPLEHRLRALAVELGLREAVDFVGFAPNVLPYFRQADAFLLSSACEGFGNVLVEALGCGTPVISTDCEHGPGEILGGGLYGVLTPPRNPTAFAVAMDGVATLRARFPADVLRRRATDFTHAACATRYMAMFKAIAPHRVVS